MTNATERLHLGRDCTSEIVSAALDHKPHRAPATDTEHEVPARTAKQWRKLATSSPAWPAIMRATGINSGALSKSDAAAICVILGIENDEDLHHEPTDEKEPEHMAETAPAPEPDAATKAAKDTLRGILNALGDGDMSRAQHTLADLHRAMLDASKSAQRANELAEQARRDAANAGPAHTPRAGDPTLAAHRTLAEITPRAVANTLPGRTGEIQIPEYDAPDTRPDPDYSPDGLALAALASADATRGNVWLYGPAGTGKSSLPEWYAATLGRPFFRVAFDRSTEPEDLIGSMMPDGQGGMAWQDGVLAQAIRVPGAVILLDEPTLARPTALAMMQTLLDGGRALLARATGERITCAPHVLIVAADNTDGSGDESGQYAGTAAMNRAFMDRMGQRIEVGYAPKDKEATILHRRAGMPKAAASALVDFAHHTRAAWQAGDMAHPLGLRRLIAWGAAIKSGWPSETAFATTCQAGENPDDREAIQQLAQAYLDHGEIDRAAQA